MQTPFEFVKFSTWPFFHACYLYLFVLLSAGVFVALSLTGTMTLCVFHPCLSQYSFPLGGVQPFWPVLYLFLLWHVLSLSVTVQRKLLRSKGHGGVLSMLNATLGYLLKKAVPLVSKLCSM